MTQEEKMHSKGGKNIIKRLLLMFLSKTLHHKQTSTESEKNSKPTLLYGLNTSSLNMHGMSSHLSILMPSSVSSSMMNGTRSYLGAVSLPSLL